MPNELEKAMSNTDPYVTKREFVAAISHLVGLVKSLKDNHDAVIPTVSSAVTEGMSKMHENTSQIMAQMKGEMMGVHNGAYSSFSESLKSEVARTLKQVQDKLLELKDGKDADEEKIKTAVIVALKPLIPEKEDVIEEAPEQTRDKLESLKGEERLDASAVKGLEKLIKSLNPQGSSSSQAYVSAASRGRVVEYDLSPQLNGVLKTFSLPVFWRVINVDASSTPYAMRKTVDFTTDANACTITFTDEIDASTTLTAGQTVIVTYSEA